MVPGFSRSISLPLSPGTKDRAALHVRSISLPCRSHPLLSHLQAQICALRSWLAHPDHSPSWIAATLARIDLLHIALDELFLLPDAHDPLRRSAAVTTDRLLDGFLRLADAYASLRSATVDLRQHQTEVRASVRRRDPARLASALRSQRRTEKELADLAAAVAPAAKGAVQLGASGAEAEMVGIFKEAIRATAAASVAIFSGAAAKSAAASSATAKVSCATGRSKKLALTISSKKIRTWEEEKETAAWEKLEEWEECIGNLESGSERVLRSLLNALTPSF